MATVVVQHQQPPLSHNQSPPPLSPALTLTTHRASTPIPNKHLPFCPPGPALSASQILTPPNSPPVKSPTARLASVLHPPTQHRKLLSSPPIYGIDAKTLAHALDDLTAQPLPEPEFVFPWLHGLHPENQIQLAFFVAKKKSLRRVPRCLRGLTLLKAGGDLTRSRLRGAIAPDEVLSLCDDPDKGFLDCDPRQGFSVRNFHIQATKMAMVSDIVIYGDDRTDQRIIKSVAERSASVQRKRKKDLETAGQCPESYNTFVLTTPFEGLERDFPDLVAVDSRGKATGHVMDLLQWERTEMCAMSKASEISQGVYQGPTPDWTLISRDDQGSWFDVLVEAADHAQIPDGEALALKAEQIGEKPVHVNFPSSGSILPPSWSHTEVDGLLRMCSWIYGIAHPVEPEQREDADGDIQMRELSPRTRKILLHCADGYTESSLLAIAYFMFAEGVPVHEAWLQMHIDKGRNFFAYPSDVALLTAVQERILLESPACKSAGKVNIAPPTWLAKMDGSLPSRILPYMYLGNLTHANNPELLVKLGIRRILSVGEPVSWTKEEHEQWGPDGLMMVDRVQDNGIDPLTGEFERCLAYIRK